jgi:hypothetical protein
MKKFTTICAIIENNNGEILLTKRGREPFKGYWSLVSGIGESKKGVSSNKGVIGEVSCDLGTESFKGELIFSLPIANDKKSDKIDVFLGKINEDEIKINPKYSQGIKWVSKKDKELFRNLAFENEKIINRYLETIDNE